MWRCVLTVVVACAAIACGGTNGPTGPTPNRPRLSLTRYLAFGDSFTAGEITNPISGQLGVVIGEWGGKTLLTTPNTPLPTLIRKQIVVPAASYPTVLQSQLQATYRSQSSSITVINSGQAAERILDGLQRFPSAFQSSQAEVVLLMEGVNGLPQVGPDISTGVMRIMVQAAKDGRARVFVGSMIPQVAGRPRAMTPVSELLAYNNTLQIMSTQEGITYVDLYNAMTPDAATLIGVDGLHPTEAGYRRIAELFFAAISRELEER